MRPWWLVGWMMACVEPQEGPDTRPQEARLIEFGSMRWTPEGHSVVRPTFAPADQVVDVFEAGERVGISMSLRHVGVRLRAYVDRSALKPTTRHATSLLLGDGYAWLPPGLDLDLIDQAGEESRVRWEGSRIRLDGWLPSAEVDHTFEPSPADLDQDRPELRPLPQIVLAGDTPIHDTPQGDVFATTQPFTDEAPDVRWVYGGELDRRDGWVRVRLSERDVVLEGWVPEASTEGMSLGGRGWGGCGGWGRHLQIDAPSLPIGTPLYDREEGLQVAVTEGYAPAPHGAPDAWLPWPIDTPWGEVTVVVPPEDQWGSQAEEVRAMDGGS